MKINHNIILVVCVIMLVALCVTSVIQPLKFNREKGKREVAVKKVLLEIKKSENSYCKRYGEYAKNLNTLILCGYLNKRLQYIPYSRAKKISLITSVQIAPTGEKIPLMECSASYKDYLYGLSENSIKELTNKALEKGQFAGLKIGDISTANNNATNWE